MQQPTRAWRNLVLLAALFPCLTNALAPAEVPGAVSYTQLAPFNGQWNVAVSIARDGSNTFTAHTCNTTVLGAACNQPPLMQKQDDQVRVTYTIKNASAPFKTLRGGVPTRMVIKLCYATVSWTDRAWRKKDKAYPRYGQDCPIELGAPPFVAAGGSATIDLDNYSQMPGEFGVPTALWYFSVCTLCDMPPNDISGKNTFCQCDRTEGKNTLETKRIDGATKSHIAAAVVLSVASPVIFLAMYFGDAMHYKRTGRALKFFRDT